MVQRQRITITIRNDLLALLDRSIDHQRIRNRSHAIEVALGKLRATDVHTAVILASGQGVKMRPFTYEIPKCLIPVGGRPLLEYSLELLRQHGITEVVLTVSHLAERIEKHFGDGAKFGLTIRYVREPKPTGTGGALLAARGAVEESPFILLYGDILLDLDITELRETHQNTKAAVATLALTSVVDPSAYGAVKLRGTRIVEFSEKPPANPSVSRLVFAGLAAMNPSVFNYTPRKTHNLSLEKDIFPKLISEGRLFGYPFEGRWFDVSTPEIYERVVKHWAR